MQEFYVQEVQYGFGVHPVPSMLGINVCHRPMGLGKWNRAGYVPCLSLSDVRQYHRSPNPAQSLRQSGPSPQSAQKSGETPRSCFLIQTSELRKEDLWRRVKCPATGRPHRLYRRFNKKPFFLSTTKNQSSRLSDIF